MLMSHAYKWLCTLQIYYPATSSCSVRSRRLGLYVPIEPLQVLLLHLVIWAILFGLSLRRLGVDHIDLYYQPHIGELKKLVEERKTKYNGLLEASPDNNRACSCYAPYLRRADGVVSVGSQHRARDCASLQRIGDWNRSYSPIARGWKRRDRTERASTVFGRKSGEEQASLSENLRTSQEAPVQPCSASFNLSSASRG